MRREEMEQDYAWVEVHLEIGRLRCLDRVTRSVLGAQSIWCGVYTAAFLTKVNSTLHEISCK